MDVPDPPPDEALDDIAFLSRSRTRTWILTTLSTTAYTRGTLEDATGIPRTSVDRAVNELEDRGWITRTPDGEYTSTEAGERIVAESTSFIEAIQAIRILGDAVAWLPHEELTIGLHHFAQATVRRPEPNAMAAPTRFATGLMQEATEFACLVNTPPSLAFEEAMMNRVSEGRMTTNHVITDGEFDTLLQDEDRAARWEDYIEAGADLYCYDGRIPCNLIVIDETVLILDRQPQAPEGIESTNPVVRSWAHETIERYRNDAELLDAAVFKQEPTNSADER